MAADAAPAFLYLATLPGPGAHLELPADAAHYVARVCRARPGDRVEATDGDGGLAVLRLTRVRDGVGAEVESLAREPLKARAWLLCGAPEGERADWLVEKLAELGIERLLPVDCERSSWARAAARRSRWERLAEAGMRQSRRTRMMRLSAPSSLEEALVSAPPDSSRWIADEAGTPGPVGSGADLTIGLVGPAAGLSERERELALAAGYLPLRLSDARLRTETAALAWAAWWSAGRARSLP